MIEEVAVSDSNLYEQGNKIFIADKLYLVIHSNNGILLIVPKYWWQVIIYHLYGQYERLRRKLMFISVDIQLAWNRRHLNKEQRKWLREQRGK